MLVSSLAFSHVSVNHMGLQSKLKFSDFVVCGSDKEAKGPFCSELLNFTTLIVVCGEHIIVVAE